VGKDVDQTDYDLLTQIEQGGHTFKPEDRTAEARAAFQNVVERLLHLRGIGLIRLPEGRLMRAVNGDYLMAGPCDLAPAGIAALANDRRLGPRPTPSQPQDPTRSE
jgi:hypothetical protein